MNPKISAEGQRAKDRLAEFRQNVNNGATAKEARAIVRYLEDPSKVPSNLPASALNGSSIKTTVSANELTTPTPTVTPPVPNVNTNTGATTAGIVNNVATNTHGFIEAQSAEAAKAKELASLLGSQTFDGAAQRSALGEQFNLPGNLSRLQDIQTQIAKSNEASNLQKVAIQSGGQGAIQGQRSITQEDREQAVRTAGLAAEASILQGNIETASTLINQAMSDYYSDRQMQNANMIQQLNYYSGIADEQTKQLLEKEKRAYEEDQKRIDGALGSVSTAIATGLASAGDIDTMNSLAGDPVAQKAYADKIVARYNSDILRREQEAHNAQLANIYDSINQRKQEATDAATQAALEQQSTFEIQTAKNEDILKHLNLLKNDPALPYLATGGTLKLASDVTKAGASVPIYGATTAAASKAYAVYKQKQNSLITLNYLLNSAAFQAIRDEKAAGVTFGALSNDERKAAAASANALINAMVTDPDNPSIVTELRGDPQVIMGYINDVIGKVETNQDRLNRKMMDTLSPGLSAEIDAQYNQ